MSCPTPARCSRSDCRRFSHARRALTPDGLRLPWPWRALNRHSGYRRLLLAVFVDAE